jgi:hypothetical protein
MGPFGGFDALADDEGPLTTELEIVRPPDDLDVGRENCCQGAWFGEALGHLDALLAALVASRPIQVELESLCEPKLGSALSAGPLALGDRTHLYGLGRYTTSLTQGSQVVIDAGLKQVDSLQGPELSGYVRTFPPATGGNIDLQPDQQLSIAPGSYGTAAIKSRSVLGLAPGDYYFHTLEVLEPQARLELAEPNAPVSIHVRDKLTFRGEVTVTGSSAFPLLFLVYQGALPAHLESRFQGTLLAPSAAIVVGSSSTPHRGAFFGREVEVQAGARVIHMPFVLEP